MMKPEVKMLFSQKGITASMLSRQIGIAHTYMYDLLEGRRSDPKRRKQIAKALGVSIVDLAQICGWN